MAVVIEKRCTICGLDVSQVKRTKDAVGRYYCDPCYTAAAASKVAVQPTVTAAAAPATPQHPTSERSAVQVKAGSALSLRAMAIWALQVAVILIGMVVFLLGSKPISMPVQPGGMTAILILSGIFAMIAFIPVAITLIFRLVFVGLIAQSTGTRVISISASVILLINLIWAWPKLSEVYGAMSGNTVADTAFAAIDSKFGFGTINNPSQFGKTSEQLQAEAEKYLGAKLDWKGVVTDVRDGQVLIQMRKISLKNDVVLKVGWWDDWKLEGIHRDDLIEFTGVLSAIGDPYAVTNGFIKSSRPLSAGE